MHERIEQLIEGARRMVQDHEASFEDIERWLGAQDHVVSVERRAYWVKTNPPIAEVVVEIRVDSRTVTKVFDLSQQPDGRLSLRAVHDLGD